MSALSAPFANPADAASIELLGSARINNVIENLTFRIATRQAHVSELRVRSGSLAVTLVSVEIEFLDGALERYDLDESLPPGHQSRPIPVDSRRPITRVFVTKQPGLRSGETAVQLIGKVEPAIQVLPSHR